MSDRQKSVPVEKGSFRVVVRHVAYNQAAESAVLLGALCEMMCGSSQSCTHATLRNSSVCTRIPNFKLCSIPLVKVCIQPARYYLDSRSGKGKLSSIHSMPRDSLLMISMLLARFLGNRVGLTTFGMESSPFVASSFRRRNWFADFVLRPSTCVSHELGGGPLSNDRDDTMFGNLCAYRCVVSNTSHSR